MNAAKSTGIKALVPILTVGVFGILNTEMGIVGLIPYVVERFGVTVPDAGLLVSVFALIVVIAGPTMPLLFSRMNRRTVMLLALGVFTVCNTVAGRALGATPRATMVVGPVVLAVLYVTLFVAGSAVIAVTVFVLALGVAVGVANTCDQYMVSRSAPKAPDFANGLFLTATNLGTTVGTSLCGALIAGSGTHAAVLGTLPLLALGLIATLARLRLDSGAADA